MPPDSSPSSFSSSAETVPDWLRSKLETAGGWLAWVEVMSEALYGTDHGYYAGNPRRVGRSGDFFTAVSVGPMYGRLLADHAAACWVRQGRPEGWWLAEQGAHDGQLMADVLTALLENHAEVARRASIVLVEPKSEYRAAQDLRLRVIWRGEIKWVCSADELPAGPGLLLCNELLDAFPVHRVRCESGQWRELGVVIEDERLSWRSQAIKSEALQAETARLPANLPEGYVTEIQIAVIEWVRELAASQFSGEVWIADYALDANEYWSAERPEGTLRRYFQHRMDGRVLENLGETDLTCHVNATRFLEAARSAGFKVLEESDQGSVLTRLAVPWLQDMEGRIPDQGTRALLRQLQTLTHPGLMGRSFRIVRLEWPA